MRKKFLLLSLVMATVLSAQAQYLREHYITWGMGGADLGATLQSWSPGQQVSEDDNFFISRVKPKARFRNAATQVMDTLQTIYDKKLIAWIPFNSLNETGWNRNALPDGKFDSEVFSMWSYVTHWGDWTAPNGRVPAALLDVAHKNGVGVSGLASVPNASLSDNWASCFNDMVSAGAEKSAQFMTYYGVDGLGYNSEWSESGSTVSALMTYHGALVKKMRETNPLFENFWYTGTADAGNINFAGQLGSWNQNTFGDKDNIRTSLFLNYNWNYSSRIRTSQSLAASLGRDPLDLYAGFNMQGANPTSWTLLGRSRYSIGLWGAHSANMFFETRHEKGSDPAVKQATYLMRTERWFGGGTRNPANLPPFVDSDNYNADNFSFHGMAKMMSARSALAWNLSEEPFITYFNLGNGKFFNWNGARQHNSQWYNIGVQDYLPTWRYWFASKLLGRQATDVPTNGLDAEFNWDDAYVGGSTMHVYGTVNNEYLHLFKTQFALQEGDVITFRYKLLEGSANANLVFTAEGAESEPINESDYNVLTTAQQPDNAEWVTKQFTVSGNLAGKTLALVALHFTNAQNLDLYFGEFSIVRGSTATPAQPVLTKTELLNAHSLGADAKLIWNMPNSKPATQVCYNTDVNTAFFKLYAQQEGKDPIYMGMTTSWAGLVFSAPMDFAAEASRNVRFGVSAAALDHKSESAIAWSDYTNINEVYEFADDIETNKTLITQDEVFTMGYSDPNHESGSWKLTHEDGNVAFSGEGHTVVVPGLSKLGNYTLELVGVEHDGSSTTTTTRSFPNYITVNDAKFGRLPEINTFTANGEEAGITVEKGTDVQMAYTGRFADGGTSQAVSLNELNFGLSVADAGLTGQNSYSLAFWIKVNKVNGNTQFFSVADKTGTWPLTDWGWNWSTLSENGSMSFTYRNSSAAEGPASSQYIYPAGTLPIGVWTHVAIVLDSKSDGKARHMLYINGQFVTPTVNVTSTTGNSATTNVADTYYSLIGKEASQYISIGGPASGRAGIDGVIDNFQLYKKAISANEVVRSMEPMVAGSLPADLSCLWNLEGAYASDYSFAALGESAGTKCGSYQLMKLEGEGRAMPHFVEPVIAAGCPQTMDTSYPILTTATWDAPKATLTNETGNSEAGSATVKYENDGVYNVTVTLTNAHGSDSRTYTAITVGDPTGINEVAADQLRAFVSGEVVYIDFKQAGNYEASVYNVAGQLVCSKSATINGSDRMRLALPQPGVYVVRITSGGKPVAAVKLLRK